MAYHLEGRLLEVCNCRVLCPCWIGEDPDFGTCDTIVAWHFDKGKIDDVDVAGRTIALIAHIPGNILQGNWKAAVYVDDKASAQQKEAILNVYTGQARRPGRRAGEAHRRSRLGRERSHHLRRAGRQGHDQSRRRRLRRARAVQERRGQDHHAHGHRIFNGARRPGVRRQVAAAIARRTTSSGINLDMKNHNALQSTFVFDA